MVSLFAAGQKPPLRTKREIMDSLYQTESDTIPTTTVQVNYDSICYDTTGQAIYQGNTYQQLGEPKLRIRFNKIHFDPNQPEIVVISLFGADGRQITELFTGTLASGSYTITLPKNTPAGVYLVREDWANKL